MPNEQNIENFTERRSEGRLVCLSKEQLDALRKEIVEETKEELKNEIFMELGKFTFNNGKNFIINCIYLIGIATAVFYYLANKAGLSNLAIPLGGK